MLSEANKRIYRITQEVSSNHPKLRGTDMNIQKRHLKLFPRLKTLGMTLALAAGIAMIPGISVAGGKCPQPRKTKSAPAKFVKMSIPANADAAAGKKIFHKTAKPMACKMCHGKDGDGQGKLGKALKPSPRDFTCSSTMKKVSAGQMFWIIKNGSKGTGMAPFGKTLKESEIWNVVKYIRTDLMK